MQERFCMFVFGQFGLFGIRHKKLLVFSIGNFDFSVFNVVKRYDTVFCRIFKHSS